jgi:putative FmdB family regulatory protein
MPIYDFRCNHCSHTFDELVPVDTTGAALRCSQCGQVGAKRLISAFAAHGLENGHIAVGRKLTGGGASAESKRETKSESSSGPAAAATS